MEGRIHEKMIVNQAEKDKQGRISIVQVTNNVTNCLACKHYINWQGMISAFRCFKLTGIKNNSLMVIVVINQKTRLSYLSENWRLIMRMILLTLVTKHSRERKLEVKALNHSSQLSHKLNFLKFVHNYSTRTVKHDQLCSPPLKSLWFWYWNNDQRFHPFDRIIRTCFYKSRIYNILDSRYCHWCLSNICC